MAIPTSTDLKTMDYSYQGQPFVNVPENDTIDTTTMDYVYQAQPFVLNPATSTTVVDTTKFFVFFG